MELASRLCNVVFNSFPEHIAIVEPDGRIKAVNAAWGNFSKINGGTTQHTGVGNNYLEICHGSAQAGDDDAVIVAKRLRQVLEGNIKNFRFEYPCHSPKQQRWFVLKCWPLHWEDSICAVVSHRDSTQPVLVREELQSQLRMMDVPDLKPGSLAEYLYSRYSLSSLEQLLVRESDELLKRRWKLTDEQCEQQIALAMHYIRQD